MNGLFANTSAADISNKIIEVSQTEIKVTLVGFDQKLLFLTLASTTNIYLPNGDVIDNLNETLLLHRDVTYLIYTEYDHCFGISAYDNK